MRARIHPRSTRGPVSTDPWSLQPVSRIIGLRPSDFIRRQAWIAPPKRFSNGISAVTSLCLVDEPSARGPPLLIAGDEDGGVSVQRISVSSSIEKRERLDGSRQWSTTPHLRRARLHDSCVNTIKLLPDQRGFVCASDDGVLSVVATLEAGSESDLRRATLALHGHSGFVTDCDTAACGHAILSSSIDGRMLLWDPVAGNTPVSSVSVGRPVNSACFSTGDPYALVCAPEREQASVGGGSGGCSSRESSSGSDELVQIWDLRSLKCFRDAIPAAFREAFGEPELGPLPETAGCTMQAPPPQPPASPNLSAAEHVRARKGSGKCKSRKQPWWDARTGGSSATACASRRSSLTPLLRRSAWASDSSDNDLSPPRSAGRSPVDGMTDSSRKRHRRPSPTPLSRVNDDDRYHHWTATPSPSSRRRYSNTLLSPGSCDTAGMGRCLSSSNASGQKMNDRPLHVLCWTAVPVESSGCLHEGSEGKSWVPGGSVSWRLGKRPALVVAQRAQDPGTGQACPMPVSLRSRYSSSETPACRACADKGSISGASVYSVQVTSDGRGILTASRDATVTLWDAQSRQVVYRFGHARLSTRARPILSGAAACGGGESPRWGTGEGRFEQGYSGGEVITGMTDGVVRAWRLGSRFPNRAFQPARRHEGFEVTCVAGSRDGAIFASADSSGKVYVQSAIGRDVSGSGEERT